MLDARLTDMRVAEAILRSERLDVEFEPADYEKAATLAGKPVRVIFCIYSTEFADGRGFIYGEGFSDQVWRAIREKLEENNL